MVVTYSAPPSIILNSKDQELIEEDSMIGISLLQALKDEANLQVHTNCCHLRRINNNPIGSEVFMLDGWEALSLSNQPLWEYTHKTKGIGSRD